jgi:hypothetical protein
VGVHAAIDLDRDDVAAALAHAALGDRRAAPLDAPDTPVIGRRRLLSMIGLRYLYR